MVAIVDSNSDPDAIDYPVPGNDDSQRAIRIYCELIAGAVLDGLQEQLVKAGVDIGERAEAPVEQLPSAPEAKEGGEAPAAALAAAAPEVAAEKVE